MALVAYDCSDFSDDDEPEIKPNHKPNLQMGVLKLINDASESLQVASSSKTSLFASLPPPKTHIIPLIPEGDVSDAIEFKAKCGQGQIQPKESKPVRITIPSLSELVEDEEKPANKKLHPSGGKGLFSVLPAPKHSAGKVTNRPLIPYSVKQKKTPVKAKSPAQLLKENSAVHESDDEDLDSPSDFFSLDSVGKLPDSGVILAPDVDIPSSSTGHAFSITSVNNDISAHDPASSASNDTNLDASASGEFGPNNLDMNDMTSLLSDEGFMRLRGHRKRGQPDIEIIDVSQADQLPSPDEWMRKVLQESTEYQPSRKKGFMPSAQQRRKHQITYLAFQAKEREMELKNQWAQNRFTRHQTQSKYGF